MSGTALLEHYLAPLRPFLAPENVTELVVNRPCEVGVEGPGGWLWHDVPELSPAWLSTLATAAAAYTRQDIGPARPLCSTVLPDGERCQIAIPPAATSVCLTVRKPSRVALDLDALAAAGLFEQTDPAGPGQASAARTLRSLRAAGDWRGFFRLAVRARRNILISGATGSGKTTFAKALIALVPEEERLITIEDARELTASHRNLVHLTYSKGDQGASTCGPGELLEAALRMRPDRILLAELRDEVAFPYLRSACSGHPGSITTIHADSPALAFEQLALLVRQSKAGRDLPRADIHALLKLLIDVVVQLRRVGGRFRITEVYCRPATEVGGPSDLAPTIGARAAPRGSATLRQNRARVSVRRFHP